MSDTANEDSMIALGWVRDPRGGWTMPCIIEQHEVEELEALWKLEPPK